MKKKKKKEKTEKNGVYLMLFLVETEKIRG
jgi:hypothetical protein